MSFGLILHCNTKRTRHGTLTRPRLAIVINSAPSDVLSDS